MREETCDVVTHSLICEHHSVPKPQRLFRRKTLQPPVVIMHCCFAATTWTTWCVWNHITSPAIYLRLALEERWLTAVASAKVTICSWCWMTWRITALLCWSSNTLLNFTWRVRINRSLEVIPLSFHQVNFYRFINRRNVLKYNLTFIMNSSSFFSTLLSTSRLQSFYLYQCF